MELFAGRRHRFYFLNSFQENDPVSRFHFTFQIKLDILIVCLLGTSRFVLMLVICVVCM